MEDYEHEFEHAEQYLHHRPPYLLVERIVSISSSEVVTEKSISGDEFFIRGHFPGAPIMPGAMMQELTTQSAGVLIAAKFNPMKEYNTSDPFFNEGLSQSSVFEAVSVWRFAFWSELVLTHLESPC